MSPRLLQIAGITGLCLAIYVGLRSLPLESCSFLHYGDYVNAEGVIEGCGYEETEFFDLSLLRFPILAEITVVDSGKVGESTRCQLSLFTTTGRPIEWNKIAVSHTKRLHAMVVDKSLEDYHHLHPEPTGAPGFYTFDFIPRKPGTYQVYLDFISLTNNRRTLLQTSIPILGEEQPTDLKPSLQFEKDRIAFHFKPRETDLPLKTGKDYTFDLEIIPPEGEKVEYGMVMGAYAHLVAFDATHRGFAHLHPLGLFPNEEKPTELDLAFQCRFDAPGDYRIYAQMNLNGEEYMLPFTITVEPATSTASL